MVEDWGTARERQRRRRRWKLAGTAVIVVALSPLIASGVLDFVDGLADGYSGAAHGARTIGALRHAPATGVVIAVLTALVVNYRLWRGSDEVERQQVATALAIAGVVALAVLPVLSLMQEPLGLESPAMVGWGLSIAAMVGVRIVQRLRG